MRSSKKGGILVSKIVYDFLDEMMTDDEKRFYQQLGERVAGLRKEHQITQVQMAKILGISQQHVASYECGRRKIPVIMLPKLSKIFELSIDELIGVKAKSSKRGPVSALNRQVEQIRLLPRTKQKFVMEMLDTVIRQQGS
jgi:transcriptional regulator with XRE-family HTH domain